MQKITDFEKYVKDRVEVDANGCWLWKLSKDADGYGNASKHGRQVRAHRLAYSVFHNIPLNEMEDRLVCHLCDVPACTNPAHLYLGSSKDNTRDKVVKHRTSRVNNKLTDEQVRYLRKNYSHLILRPGEVRAQPYTGPTFRSLGEEYGVAYHTIRDIISGATYKHVEENQ